MWAQTSRREIAYALCEDRRTLLWFANQRAVEYHPSLARVDRPSGVDELVLDIDPPDADNFALAVRVATAAREVLLSAGLDGAVKTSGSKGLHIWAPLEAVTPDEAAAATRALSARTCDLVPEIATTQMLRADRGKRVLVDATRVGRATLAAAFSPRALQGLPISFPVAWEDLPEVEPRAFDIRSFASHLDQARTWRSRMPRPMALPEDLVEEGRSIPPARPAAMHEGRRRAREAEAPRN